MPNHSQKNIFVYISNNLITIKYKDEGLILIYPEIIQISSVILVTYMKRTEYNPELHTCIYAILISFNLE